MVISGRTLKPGPCSSSPLTFTVLSILYKRYHPTCPAISQLASCKALRPTAQPGQGSTGLSHYTGCLIALLSSESIYPNGDFNINLSNSIYIQQKHLSDFKAKCFFQITKNWKNFKLHVKRKLILQAEENWY